MIIAGKTHKVAAKFAQFSIRLDELKQSFYYIIHKIDPYLHFQKNVASWKYKKKRKLEWKYLSAGPKMVNCSPCWFSGGRKTGVPSKKLSRQGDKQKKN